VSNFPAKSRVLFPSKYLYLDQLFSKHDLNSLNVAKIGQNWPKLTGYFHVFQVMERIADILRTNTVKNETFSKNLKKFNFCQFLPILATFYELKITF
jgi:hypothetical protein